MFEKVKFKQEHLEPMLCQKSNNFLMEWIKSGNAKMLEADENSVTGMLNGIPAVCGGVVKIWGKRGSVWTIFNEDCSKNFMPVFRGVRLYLNQFKDWRLEMACPAGHDTAMRRALLLGFELEVKLARKYFENGSDATLFAKVGG